MKNPFNFPEGTIVEGKWHKNVYRILRQIGYGANGTVFLAEARGVKVALKMSSDTRVITSEVNVLKSFAKAQGKGSLGPSLFDVDDWFFQTQVIPFYVMEYVEGLTLFSFLEQKGKSWVPVLTLQLLEELDTLHRAGWVFGDLKPENIIITPSPHRIRFIDVGGATKISRAIKEYTEFFDRGYWGLGSRKAEPSYDLFAVAMIIINCYYPSRFKKNEGGASQLQSVIRNHHELRKFADILIKAITGGYKEAQQMRQDLVQSLQKGSYSRSNNLNQRYRAQKSSRKPQRKWLWNVLETIFILSVISFLYLAYLWDKMM